MTERPILFSAPMVRALLSDAKTQTRRIVKPQPRVGLGPGHNWFDSSTGKSGVKFCRHAESIETCAEFERIACPYGAPGDRLWVRETWAPAPPIAPLLQHVDATPSPELKALYRANLHQAQLAVTWKPSIHMPRWASRITLEVTGVRVERLQSISEADAMAEGVDLHSQEWPDSPGTIPVRLKPSFAFELLWRSINGPDSWAANPWVWVVEFKRVTP